MRPHVLLFQKWIFEKSATFCLFHAQSWWNFVGISWTFPEHGKQYGDLQNLMPTFAKFPWNFRKRVFFFITLSLSTGIQFIFQFTPYSAHDSPAQARHEEVRLDAALLALERLLIAEAVLGLGGRAGRARKELDRSGKTSAANMWPTLLNSAKCTKLRRKKPFDRQFATNWQHAYKYVS